MDEYGEMGWNREVAEDRLAELVGALETLDVLPEDDTERRWLLDRKGIDAFIQKLEQESTPIRQGYVEVGSTTVRIRQEGEHYYINFKIDEIVDGFLTRREKRLSISRDDFALLYPLAKGWCLDKMRYTIRDASQGIEFDIDVYGPPHDGLVMVEMAPSDKNISPEEAARLLANAIVPEWLSELGGVEITELKETSNSAIAKRKNAVMFRQKVEWRIVELAPYG